MEDMNGGTVHVVKTRPMIARELAAELDAAEWEQEHLKRLSRGTLLRLATAHVPGFTRVQTDDPGP